MRASVNEITPAQHPRIVAFAFVLTIAVGLTSCTSVNKVVEPTVHSVGIESIQDAQWQAPNPGDLVVLDFGDGSGLSQLLLISSDNGAVRGSLPAGSSPDFAFSPDGKLLLVSSFLASEQSHVIQLYDLESGKELDRVANDFMARFGVPTPLSRFAVPSQNNVVFALRLYLGRNTSVRGDTRLATFDLASREFLEDDLDLGGCYTPVLLTLGPTEIAMVCGEQNVMAFANLHDDGSGEIVQTLALRTQNSDRKVEDVNGNPVDMASWAAAIRHPLKALAYVVSRSGHVWMVNLESREVIDETNLPLRESEWIPPNVIGISGNGDGLFIGVGNLKDRLQVTGQHSAHSLLLLDSATLATSQRINSSKPFDGLTVGYSSNDIYLFGARSSHIEIIELDTDLSRILADVAIAPSRVVSVGS